MKKSEIEESKWCVFCNSSPKLCNCDDSDDRIRWAVWAHIIPTEEDSE